MLRPPAASPPPSPARVCLFFKQRGGEGATGLRLMWGWGLDRLWLRVDPSPPSPQLCLCDHVLSTHCMGKRNKVWWCSSNV